MQNKKYENILCFGEILWDKLPTGAEPGGAPMNVAIHLKKQGQNPVVISKIGNDAEGRELIRFLSESGLNTDFIQTDETLNTSEVLVHLDENKHASYEICEPVAWDNLQFEDGMTQIACATGAFVASQKGAVPNYSAAEIEKIINSSVI